VGIGKGAWKEASKEKPGTASPLMNSKKVTSLNGSRRSQENRPGGGVPMRRGYNAREVTSIESSQCPDSEVSREGRKKHKKSWEEKKQKNTSRRYILKI